MDSNNLPLSGLVVLEFTHAVMGPTTGLLLADMGAEVIHIEPVDGDSTRRLKGFGTGYFTFYSRNKKSLALDIKSEDGKKIIADLAKSADILVENFGPGTMDRLGFGYESIRELNSRLIYCSLKGFMPGPYEKRHAMDEVVQMMGGLAYMTGRSGDPLRAGTSVIDITGGMFGLIGILTALYERQITGLGKFVQASLFETTTFLMGQHMAYGAITQTPVPPMPERVSAWSIYRIFETSDHQQIFIGIISEKHWHRFCEVFDAKSWLENPNLTTNNDRIAQRDWFLPEVELKIGKYSKSQVIQLCESADIPFAQIARPEDLWSDQHLVQSKGLVEIELQDGQTTMLPKIPLKYGDTIFNLNQKPPSIGQNNEEIFNRLGLSPEVISDLKNKGTI